MHLNRTAIMNRLSTCRGFTMVELLAAIAIILILSGLGIGAATYASRRADISRARSDMEQIANALERYRTDHGTYPGSDSTTFQDMALAGEWRPPFNAPELRPYMEGLPMSDPWGGPGGQSYQYRRISRYSFQLRSLGADGLPNTSGSVNNKHDDIEWPF